MRQVLCLLGLLSVGMTGVACSRDMDENPLAGARAGATASEAKGKEVTVTECLTGTQDNKFVLTAEANPVNSTTARAGAGTLPTYTYELVGGQNLKDHPREQVTIKGRLDEDKDRVEVEKKERSEQATDQKASTPTVDLKQEVDLRVRRLFVESVTPTGQPCDSAAK